MISIYDDIDVVDDYRDIYTIECVVSIKTKPLLYISPYDRLNRLYRLNHLQRLYHHSRGFLYLQIQNQGFYEG